MIPKVFLSHDELCSKNYNNESMALRHYFLNDLKGPFFIFFSFGYLLIIIERSF